VFLVDSQVEVVGIDLCICSIAENLSRDADGLRHNCKLIIGSDQCPLSIVLLTDYLIQFQGFNCYVRSMGIPI
jgi:hypothetical protein